MLPEFGKEGQTQLENSRVLIVGLGGLGAPVATYLTGAGVGHIGLCDADVVSLCNLQRQVLYTESQIGAPKVQCACQRLQAINSEVSFSTYSQGLTLHNALEIIRNYNLVIDCTDNFATRYLIDDICHEVGIPWVHGAIGEFNGQVSVFNYPSKPRRFTHLLPDRDALCTLPARTLGVLGAVPGVIGAMQACEAIKILTGCGEPLAGKLFSINLITLQSEIIDF